MPRTHASLPRLFVEPGLAAGGEVALDADRSLYLATVLRKAVGDEVVLFNGRDGAWLGRLTQAAKRHVVIALDRQIAPQPAPANLWYGFAPLKAARLDYVVQKATEMGVSAIQPVITRFTQGKAPAARLIANAIEAAEQCEVLNVPAILPEIALPRLLADWKATQGDRLLVLGDEAAPSASPVGRLAAVAGRPIGLLVGPEGGFADEERELLLSQPFVVPISLGPRILRADTAAVAALAVIQSIIGDWR
ncbi:MAG TPA: 16S rRNA (uracil(1498)-N(3))-methyltransferase [Devosiaceae bacterium]|nr:16S rRNA (uracil(1498)-N(3))-methyltransferase [Devosiaceae bacterium]